MNRLTSKQTLRSPGFTLLEFLVVFATFMVIIAGVFAQIGKFQQVYTAEGTKVDASQESRTMLDEIAHELHQSGYPNQYLIDPSVLAVTVPANSKYVAAGLVKVSNYELWFEGDIDGDGVVDVVHYMLMDSSGSAVTASSTCPCTLQRSQVQKADATAPTSQTSTTWASGLSNILNSGGVGAGGAALTISGTTNGTSNDTLYSAYKTPKVFVPLDQNGNAITSLPIDYANNLTTISTVKSIVVTVNTLTLNSDLQTRAPVPFTNTVTVKLNN